MPNVLEVQIVGDVSSLEKSLKQAESLQAEYTKSIEKTSSELKESITVTNGYKKAIDDLNSELKSGAISSKDYSKQLANLKRDEKESAVATADLRKELSNLKREQKDLGGSFSTAGKKIADGGNALNQFSRIAQDAPFGIQGIGNNITATVEAFGHLQKSTGSTGAALKAVASSMLGSGGILLAVSLVTTGLTYMAQNGITVGDVFDKLTGTFDKNAKALSEIGSEAAKNSKEEISSLNAYVAAASNVNLKMSDRLIAVKKLQDEYPAYFGNLTQEQILNGNVAGAVNKVTEALIQKAKAAAFSSRIADLAEKEFLLRQDEEKGINKLKKAYKDLDIAKKKASSGGAANVAAGFGSGASEGFSGNEANANLEKAKSSLGDIQNELRSNLATQKLYTEELNKSTAAQLGLETETTKNTKTPKAKKAKVEKAKKDTFDEQKSLDKLAELAFQMQEVTDVPLFNTDKTEENLNKLTDLSQEMAYAVSSNFGIAQQAADVFSQGTTSAIGALGNGLASSLETGNAALDAFTGSVIKSFADIAAAQLAGLIAKQTVATTSLATDAAVSTGNAVTAATETAAASGPAAAFILPALVGAAIGFIAASFAGIKFAHGGIVPGGSYTGDKIPAMLNSGEAVMNSQQQANTLMAIANGNSNALQSNRKSSTFNLETKLRGSDILLALKREEKSR